MHKITKRLHFCYGHRLLDYDGKCAHPHGHNGIVDVVLAGDQLDADGMLLDFREIKRLLGGFIDMELDHRMILREDDPLVAALETAGESVFRMRENPTAENLAKLIYQRARALRIPVVAIRLWETPTSCAEYAEQAE